MALALKTGEFYQGPGMVGGQAVPVLSVKCLLSRQGLVLLLSMLWAETNDDMSVDVILMKIFRFLYILLTSF